MKKRAWLVFTHALALAAGLSLLTASALSQDAAPKPSHPTLLPGQSATLLPDGRWLLLGGLSAEGPVETAVIRDGETLTQLAGALNRARAWHSATVASDGSVIVIGGIGSNGKIIAKAERFDPESGSFSPFTKAGLTPRSHHSATLLTDGEILIVGGISRSGKTLGTVELLNPKNGTVTTGAGTLATPRSGQTATLQADGSVLIAGGVDAQDVKVESNEVYDPKTQGLSVPANGADTNTDGAAVVSPAVSGSMPADGATNVSVNTAVSIRFSQPVQVSTANAATITLSGPDGSVATKVVAAEAGRLAFVNPNSPLAPGTTYTVTVDGVTGTDGTPVPTTSLSFTTAAKTSGASALGLPAGSAGTSNASGVSAGVWIPTNDWLTHLPPSPWQSLPPLRAPSGVTALSGQVLTIDGSPLPNVSLQVGKRRVQTDGSGRFLLPGLTPGSGMLLIVGTTANNNGRSFGIFEAAVLIAPRITNVLSFTIWMPVLDTAHAITIPSPTTGETVASNPLMPGLVLHIPAGTTITDINGKTVRTITMTPVPLDRPPFPLPAGVQVPIYFTIQPGGAKLWAPNGKWAWAELIYPNSEHFPPGSTANFWNYNPEGSGWYVYGQGTVSADGLSVVPNPGVGFYEFTGAMEVNYPQRTDTNGCGMGSGGTGGGTDPVDCSSGVFIHEENDLHLADVIPIDLRRTYLSQDNNTWSFGIGTIDDYDQYLTLPPNTSVYAAITLILPDGEQIQYTNTTNPNNNFSTAYFVPTLGSDPAYYGSTIIWNGNCAYDFFGCWNLTRKNGTTYVFPEEAHLNSVRQAGVRAIIDRYGNTVTITRDGNGNKTQITSPNGRWIQFQNDTTNNHISSATDDIGRTVSYTYNSYSASGRPTCNSNGMLCAVTDANGGVTSYSYDSSNRMLTVTDPRGYTQVTNTYDPTSGRVTQQTLADGTSTYKFSYTPSSGRITQTSITDPNGNVEKKSFDSNGFVTTDVLASGVSGVQQTFSYTRNPNTELVTGVTDQLSRQFNYGYDGNGNLTSISCQNCLSQAVSASLTYTPAFNELATLTDPNNNTWTIGYDSHGNPTSITDPLNHQVTLGYNSMGELTSAADAMNDTVQFGYVNGDLTQITDPLGNLTRLFLDNAGRLLSVIDPFGNATQLTYDNLDHLTQITDANNKTTILGYDPDGDLLSLIDANNNKTSYVYDIRDRVTTRTDALTKSDGYGYDANSNLLQYTDRNGAVTAYTYDALNRRAFAGFGKTVGKHGAITYSAGTINYTWDGSNRLTQAVDSVAGTIGRAYDGLNRLSSETTPQGTVGYTYDNAGRRLTMTVPGQSTLNYTWDNANRLTQIAQGSSTVGFAYDNANRRTTLTLPNNVTVAYTYDNDSRVTGMTYSAGSTQLGNLTYAYDADGRRTSKGGSLAAVTLPSAVSSSTTAYNVDNEQTKFGSASSMTYDADGELKSDGTNTYTWDARRHLTAISGGATASFVYDAFGRRMSKTVSGTVTQFMYDRFNPVQELNSSGGVTANLLTGLKIDEFFTRTASSTTSTMLADALGSTIGLVGSSGSIATSYTYQPFGGTTTGGAGNTNPYQFTGRENDGTGLYFYRARYYSPTFQRFIGQDPLGFRGGDPNLYAYVSNGSTNWIDPWGLLKLPPDPSGLPPGWKLDPTHKYPFGERYTDPNGNWLDWHPGNPTSPRGGWNQRPHWHCSTRPGDHLLPGQDIPELDPPPGGENPPSAGPEGQGPVEEPGAGSVPEAAPPPPATAPGGMPDVIPGDPDPIPIDIF